MPTHNSVSPASGAPSQWTPDACPNGWTPHPAGKRQRILYYTQSAGYEHSVVRRDNGRLSHSEQILTEMGDRAGFAVECTKNGRIFDGNLDDYDAIAFYTLGNLCDQSRSATPAMTQQGKQRLLEAIAGGKAFVGFHAASDTFFSHGVDPYITMLGAEFCGHGPEQQGTLSVKSPEFPGIRGLDASLSLFEEWYVYKKVHHEMHVVLALETRGMKSRLYSRPPTPSTWARMFGRGRVFFTSLGHREDVWENPVFQQIAFGGIAWSLGNAPFDIPYNFHETTPGGDFYQRVYPPEPGTVSR